MSTARHLYNNRLMFAPRLAVPMLAVWLAGCSAFDSSKGTFDLAATGAVVGNVHGAADGSHSRIWNDAYYVSFDFDSASSPLRGVRRFTLSMAKRPQVGRYAIGQTPTPDATKHAGFFVTTTDSAVETPRTYWTADSGTVDFDAVAGRLAFTGGFIAFLTCKGPKCGDTMSHAVVRGHFRMHD